ncbi:MAG: hypothetical protein RIB58_06620 [Phycisphaerales bacterium]
MARLGGVGLAAVGAGGVLALAWALRTAGPAETAGASLDVDRAGQAEPPARPPDQPPAGPAPLTPDAWLAAQPLAMDPPEALPEGFWKADAGDLDSQAAPATAARLEVVGGYGRQNVVLHDASGNVHELTGFTQQQHVYDAAVCSDGSLAYVWHMAFRPRQVSVYDLGTRELLHRFAPGSGGELRWAKRDPVLLLTTGGMGMGGSMVRAFAPDGTGLLQTGIGAQAMSPDDRWVLSVSWLNGQGRVVVYRIATGERAMSALLPKGPPAGVTFFMVEPVWDDDRGPVLRIVIDPEHGTAEAFELNRLVPILERDARADEP